MSVLERIKLKIAIREFTRLFACPEVIELLSQDEENKEYNCKNQGCFEMEIKDVNTLNNEDKKVNYLYSNLNTRR